jgi:hypothetical protein
MDPGAAGGTRDGRVARLELPVVPPVTRTHAGGEYIRGVRRDELRTLLVETGLELLSEEGLSRGAERLTFKRVFDRVEAEQGVRVTNASVIGRIWDSMEDYQNEVLRAALNDVNEADITTTFVAGIEILEGADLSTRAGRRAAVVELCRVACQVHAETIERSRSALIFIGARGLAVSRLAAADASDADIGIIEIYDDIAARVEGALQQVFDVLGLRVRAGLELRSLSIGIVALAEGCNIWGRMDAVHTRDIPRPTGVDGTDQPWSLFAIAVEALLWQFLEWVDDVDGTHDGAHLPVDARVGDVPVSV